jgi:hypothetical protein
MSVLCRAGKFTRVDHVSEIAERLLDKAAQIQGKSCTVQTTKNGVEIFNVILLCLGEYNYVVQIDEASF